MYLDTDDMEVVVPAIGGKIHPIGEWGHVYRPLLQPKEDNRDSVQGQLEKLLSRPPPQIIMAPERKLPTFGGRPGEVADFVNSMRSAFATYAIPDQQQGAFILDYLKDGPKMEVKSLIREGKGIADILSYIQDSYADHVPVGELQRLFLERKQQKGESVREFALDIENRFLRLASWSGRLYSEPEATLAEQFIEGIGDRYLRNTLQDRYEGGTSVQFRELGEVAIRREQREEARFKSSTGTVHQTALQSQLQTQTNRPDVVEMVRAGKELADRVVGAVSDLATSLKPPLTRNAENVQCFNCSGWGHYARECPHKRQGLQDTRARQDREQGPQYTEQYRRWAPRGGPSAPPPFPHPDGWASHPGQPYGQPPGGWVQQTGPLPVPLPNPGVWMPPPEGPPIAPSSIPVKLTPRNETARLRQEGSVAISARQTVVLEAQSTTGTSEGPFEVLLEPGECSALPVGLDIQPCFVRIDQEASPIVICNKEDEIVIPKAVQLGALCGKASVVREMEQDELSVENYENPVDVDWTSLYLGERTDLEGLPEKHREVFSARGQYERLNHTLHNMLGSLPESKKRRWNRYLPSFVYAYNSTVHASAGVERFDLMSGRNGRLPHGLVLSGEGQPGRQRNVKSYVQQHQSELRTARPIARAPD